MPKGNNTKDIFAGAKYDPIRDGHGGFPAVNQPETDWKPYEVQKDPYHLVKRA